MRRFEYWFQGQLLLETLAKNRQSAENMLLKAIKIKQREIIKGYNNGFRKRYYKT